MNPHYRAVTSLDLTSGLLSRIENHFLLKKRSSPQCALQSVALCLGFVDEDCVACLARVITVGVVGHEVPGAGDWTLFA